MSELGSLLCGLNGKFKEYIYKDLAESWLTEREKMPAI